jgi:endonuclease/exonuclease/phosphatase family metal-dependent hydrolase
MKFHLLSYNIHKLNTKGDDAKFHNYFKGLYLKVDIICLKEH